MAKKKYIFNDKTVNRKLKKLIEEGLVISKERRYRLSYKVLSHVGY